MTGNQEPTDLEKVLEAMELMSTFQLATVGDEDSIAKLKEVEELPEPMKKWLEKQDEDPDETPDPDADPKVDKLDDNKPDDDKPDTDKPDVDKTDDTPAPALSFGIPKPEVKDFENEIEYAKALIRWDGAMKAAARPTYSYKKPEKTDFFTDEEYDTAKSSYDEFVKALKEDLSPVLGEAIKKSLVPDYTPDEDVNFTKIYEAADSAQTWDQFASEVGIKE